MDVPPEGKMRSTGPLMTSRRTVLSLAAAGVAIPALGAAETAVAQSARRTAQYDVIVIGAGFAGLTAARELSQLGHKVVVLEARDRPGGRTYTDKFAGQDADLGGTWIHWTQGNIWSEVTRYGIELEESPAYSADDVIFLDYDGVRHQGKMSELGPELYDAVQKMMADARTIVPRPAEPFVDTTWVSADKLSIADKLKDPTLPKNGKILADAFFSLIGAGDPQTVSWVEVQRLYALCGYDLTLTNDVLVRLKVKGGMKRLYDALAADCGAKIEFSTIVESVTSGASGAQVRVAGGRTYSASAVVSTIPLNVLKNVKFSPPLPPTKLKISQQGHAGRCIKVHVLLDREYPMFSAFAPGSGGPSPIRQLMWEGVRDGRTHLLVFGSDERDLLNTDFKAMQAAIRRFLPDAVVLESRMHDWDSDPYSLGVWCTAHPGQISGSLAALQEPSGRIFFASADWASTWRGFIDGAIEQGIVNARKVHNLLNSRRQS